MKKQAKQYMSGHRKTLLNSNFADPKNHDLLKAVKIIALISCTAFASKNQPLTVYAGKIGLSNGTFMLLISFTLVSIAILVLNLRLRESFAALLFCIPVLLASQKASPSRGDASIALSNGVFNGHRSQSVPFLLSLVIVLTILVAVSYLALRNRSRGNSPSETSPSHREFVGEKWKYSKNALVVFIVSLLFQYPNLSEVSNQLSRHKATTNFDTLNLDSWLSFRSDGWVPMRDFWFPYGGYYVYWDGLFGLILVVLTVSLVLSLLTFIAYQCGMRSLEIAMLMLILVPVLSINWYITCRYLFPVSATLFYFILGSRSRWYHSLPLAISLFLSPEISLITFSSIFLLNIFEAVSRKSAQYLKVLIFPCLAFVAVIFNYIRLGSGENLAKFILNPKASSQYSFNFDSTFMPTKVFNDYSNFSYGLFYLLFVSLVSVILMSQRGEALSFEKKSAIYLFIVFTYLFSKNQVRGGMLPMLLLLGLPLIIVSWRIFNNAKFSIVFSKLSLVLLVIFLSDHGIMNSFISSIKAMPRHVLSSPQAASEIISNGNFMHSTFSSEGDEDELAWKQLHEANPKESIYVFGDRSDLYWASGDKPFWTISLYDSSPMEIQKRIVSELMSRNPGFVFADRSSLTADFDGVPTYLRLPIISKYIVQNYIFLSSNKTGDFLSLRKENTPIDYDYWNSLFGPKLDLGYLGFVSQIPRACIQGSESSSSESCDRYYINYVEAPSSIQVNCRQGSYEIINRFEGSPFVLNLSKLWFWNDSCRIENLKSTDFRWGQTGGLY